MEIEKNGELKCIFIPPETHKRLLMLKAQWEFKTIGQAIDYLIDSYILASKYGMIKNERRNTNQS